nr:hypothetical protein [Candidatus Sigynarchaeota archaeon]
MISHENLPKKPENTDVKDAGSSRDDEDANKKSAKLLETMKMEWSRAILKERSNMIADLRHNTQLSSDNSNIALDLINSYFELKSLDCEKVIKAMASFKVLVNHVADLFKQEMEQNSNIFHVCIFDQVAPQRIKDQEIEKMIDVRVMHDGLHEVIIALQRNPDANPAMRILYMNDSIIDVDTFISKLEPSFDQLISMVMKLVVQSAKLLVPETSA